MQKVLKNKDVLDEIYSHRNKLDAQISAVKEVVERMIAKREQIDTAAFVQKKVLEDTQ